MVYETDITVIAATTDANPQRTKIKLTHGVIHKYEVYFPPGCANLVKVRICDALHQVWPTNPEGYHKGNNSTLSFREHLPLDTEPYTLDIITSSPSATYNHVVTLRFAILPKRVVTPWLLSWAEKLGFSAGQE